MRIAAALAGVLVLLALLAGTARADGTAPTIVSVSVSQPDASCSCVDVTLVVDGSGPADLTFLWGAPDGQPQAPFETDPIEISPTHPEQGPITRRWQNAIWAVASNAAFQNPRVRVENDYGTATASIPAIPRPTRSIPLPTTTITVAPAGPAAILVGDTQTFTITVVRNNIGVQTNHWESSVRLPGDERVDDVRANAFFDLVSATTTRGACSGRVRCDLGDFPAGTTAVITLVIRARALGEWQMQVAALAGDSVFVPVSAVERKTDLAVATAAAAVQPGRQGGFHAQVAVENHGPHPAIDAVVTVGLPRGVTAVASVGGRACSPAPIRCTLPPLADGARVVIALSGRTTAKRPVGLPVGIVTKATDAVGSNNAARIVLAAALAAAKR